MMNGQRYLIITGSHPDVREDINAVPWARTDTAPEELWRLYDYMAIGLDAVDKYLWPVKYVATYHPAELPEIRSRREAVGGNLDYRTIAHDKTNDPDIVIADWWRPSGSSALLGVRPAPTKHSAAAGRPGGRSWKTVSAPCRAGRGNTWEPRTGNGL